MDPSLKDFVTKEKGKNVLYVQLDKALYERVQFVLLWYELYSTTLQDMGRCVANADIDGKQCTIVWYVDDNKISHIDSNVIDNVINKIEK